MKINKGKKKKKINKGMRIERDDRKKLNQFSYQKKKNKPIGTLICHWTCEFMKNRNIFAL